MARDSFVFHKSFFDAMAFMSDADKLTALDALCRGALDGGWPESSACPAIVNLFLAQAKPLIASDQKRYETKVPSRRGNKGEGIIGEGDGARCEVEGGGDSVPVIPSVGGVEKSADVLDGLDVKKKRFFEKLDKSRPPSLQILYALCRVEGLRFEVADGFHEKFSKSNWRDNHGGEIRDWVRIWQRWVRDEPRQQPDKDILTPDGQLLPVGITADEWDNLQNWLSRHAPQLTAISPDTYLDIRGRVCINQLQAVGRLFEKLAEEKFSDLPNIAARARELRENDEELSRLVRYGY